MQYACSNIATLAIKLKHQYRAILCASPAFGSQKQMTKEVDALGSLIKELEDAVVVLQLKLQENETEPLVAESSKIVKPARRPALVA